MKHAVVSIGTNSTRLLVVEESDGALEPVLQRSTGTRLGENLREEGHLASEAVTRTLAVVDEYMGIIRAQKADASAIATSAMRRATDAKKFAREVEARVGAPLEIVQGEREAELSYRGATAKHRGDDRVGVLDAGGGSVEFACGRRGVIENRVSCEIGAVRLSEAIPELLGAKVPADPLGLEGNARKYAADHLRPLGMMPRVKMTYAVGGTAFNAAMIVEDSDRETLDCTLLTGENLTELARRFLALDTAARRAQPRISAQRADIFPAGLLIIDTALQILRLQQCTLSRLDLLYGYLLEKYPR
ncbi:MAG: hypothetical protein JO101_07225 [Candidatus Eremiobacteraeota bacterium]|nr:hypothetical protein [Candidatus Eremiobacteraeota bacterium]MBV8355096.1 hypothetical protein [Candidatus Eremiobacteraeota bacterium]